MHKRQHRWWAWTGFALSALLLSWPVLAADWHYTLRPGESLAQVAIQCCGDAGYRDRISKYNNLDQRSPVPVGARLRIPVEWLQQQPAKAQVLVVTGRVLANGNRTLQVGDQLGVGDRLTTGADSLALVQFADNSTLQINPQAEVVFDLLSAFGDAGMVDTLIRFERGRGELNIVRQQQNRLRVSTPTGIAAVRGTQFRVAAAQTGPSLVETAEGLVEFVTPAAPGNATPIEAGYGVVAAVSGVSKEALLPAPGPLVTPGVPSHKAVVSWPRLPGARAYQIQLFKVVGNTAEPIRSFTTKRRQVVLRDLAPAIYQVQVRGVAASKLQGLDAQAQVTIVAKPPANRPWWLLSLFAVPLLFL